MDLYEGLRWAHLVLSVVGLLWLGLRCMVRWKDYPYTTQLFLLTMNFYIIATAYGTAEALYFDVPSGPRIYAYLVGVLALLVTLALTQHRRATLPGMQDMGGGPKHG